MIYIESKIPWKTSKSEEPNCMIIAVSATSITSKIVWQTCTSIRMYTMTKSVFHRLTILHHGSGTKMEMLFPFSMPEIRVKKAIQIFAH